MRIGWRHLLCLALAGCEGPGPGTSAPSVPSTASFVDSGVSAFMERRCGSLDCHGQPGRPLRLYSEWGLRLGERRGPTTPEERIENYRAVIGLEPEALARCLQSGGEDHDGFQLLLKPVAIEGGGVRHGGGAVLRPTPSDAGWQCLFGWASGAPNAEECARAARVP